MASPRSTRAGSARRTSNAIVTAPATLVAACPDGNDVPTVPPRSVSTAGRASNGRGRSTSALIPSERRSALQTAAAVSAAVATMRLRVHAARPAARAIQTAPAYPTSESPTKTGSSGPTRCSTTHRNASRSSSSKWRLRARRGYRDGAGLGLDRSRDEGADERLRPTGLRRVLDGTADCEPREERCSEKDEPHEPDKDEPPTPACATDALAEPLRLPPVELRRGAHGA